MDFTKLTNQWNVDDYVRILPGSDWEGKTGVIVNVNKFLPVGEANIFVELDNHDRLGPVSFLE